MKTGVNKNTTVEWLRIFAALMIVCIHAQFCPQSKLYNIAVPLFSVVSGFFWTRKIETCDRGMWVDLVLHRMGRLLIPLVVWSVFYWVVNNVIFDCWVKGGHLLWPTVHSWCRIVLTGGAASHLWFLSALFYMSIVVMVLVLGFNGQLIRICVLGVVAMGCCMAVNLIDQSSSATISGWIKLYFARLGIFFSIGGMMALLPIDLWNVSLTRWLCVSGLLVGCVVQWLCVGLYAGSLLVVALFACALVYRSVPLTRWGASCAASAMDIYLIHVLFVSGFSFALVKMELMGPAFGALSAVAAFFVSWFASTVLRNVKTRLKERAVCLRNSR